MNRKYEYKFVRLRLKGSSWTGKVRTDYQDEIIKYANESWRFVQAFAPAKAGYGSARYVDLIFEKDVR